MSRCKIPGWSADCPLDCTPPSVIYKPGDRVEVNGNPQGRILRQYSARMWEVRLFDGLRHVGDVCVDESDIQRHE